VLSVVDRLVMGVLLKSRGAGATEPPNRFRL